MDMGDLRADGINPFFGDGKLLDKPKAGADEAIRRHGNTLGGFALDWSSRSVMHALQRPFKVFLELCECPVVGGGTRHQHVVVARTHELGRNEPDGGLQPAADAIAHDRPAELLRHRIAETGIQRIWPRDLSLLAVGLREFGLRD